MKKRILITNNLPREHFAELREHFDLLFPQGERLTPGEMEKYLPQTNGIITSTAFKMTAAVMDMAPNLKIVASYGVGYDNIDVEAATARGITVTNNPIPVLEPTAEHAYALMLSLARGIPRCDRELRTGKPKWGIMDNLGTSLYGKTLGIVGLGRIGKAVCRYAAASRMKILYHNRRRLSETEEKALGVQYVDFDTLLKESDVVTIHLPLSPGVRHMFGQAQFRKMKSTALLVNTARGPVVDDQALAVALQSGEIAGAALDVFEHEPKVLPALLLLDNVVLTPHIGTNTRETRQQMSFYAARNVIRFFGGDPDIDRVN